IYSDAANAVRAATAVQRAIAEHSRREGAFPSISMGLASGEAELREGRYFGTVLPLAVALAKAAHGAQLIASSVTAELLRGSISSEFSIADLARHVIDQRESPQQFYQVDGVDPRRFPP